MKISNSAKDRYTTCGQMYKLHYIDKIRPTHSSSPLLWGSAIDLGLNELLLKTGKDAYETFIKHWTHAEINKINTYLPTSPNVLYSKKDFDPSLLTENDYAAIDQLIEAGTIKEFNYEEIAEIKADKRQGWKTLTDEQKSFYNIYSWYSLKNKAKYFFEAYEREVIPKIKKVHNVQRKISLSNGVDEITGLLDFEAELHGYEGMIILDNKTASKKYTKDSVLKSSQLAIYSYATDEEIKAKYAGYIVLLKDLNPGEKKTCKKCGTDSPGSHKTCNATIKDERCNGEFDYTYNRYAEVQIIIDEIPLEFKEKTVEEYDAVVQEIKAEKFEKNLNSCHMQFGAPCIYRDYCHSGSMEGLIKNE